MRFRLRTLLIVLTLGPPLLAGAHLYVRSIVAWRGAAQARLMRRLGELEVFTMRPTALRPKAPGCGMILIGEMIDRREAQNATAAE
jgi:hypothetical protein